MRRLLTRLLGGRPASHTRVSSERRRTLGRLEAKLGVRFKDIGLLERALTHRSYLSRAKEGEISNERMEFLGDAVLGLAVSGYLYGMFPDESEGVLTKKKSLIVSGTVLAKRAEALGLGRFLRLSAEESAGGGRSRESILADAFEAVVGAVYLDQGLPASEGVISRHLLSELDTYIQSADHINYKSHLQEMAQAEHRTHPEYRVRHEAGPDHRKTFTIDVVVAGNVMGTGKGKSKKEAEQRAARQALESHKKKKKPGVATAAKRSGSRHKEEEGREPRARPRRRAPRTAQVRRPAAE